MTSTNFMAILETPSYTVIKSGANGASVANGGNGLNGASNPLNFPVYITVDDAITVTPMIVMTGQLVSDTARVVEKIKRNLIAARGGSDAPSLIETITAVVVSAAGSVLTLNNESTGIGSQQIANATLRNNTIRPQATTDVTFTGSHSITLRKPEFGEQDEYGVVRVQQETRDRDLVIFQDPIWPTTEKFLMEFKWLNETVSQSLVRFLAATAGQRLTFTDHLGRSWEGFITNPDTAIQQAGKKNFTAKLEFQITG